MGLSRLLTSRRFVLLLFVSLFGFFWFVTPQDRKDSVVGYVDDHIGKVAGINVLGGNGGSSDLAASVRIMPHLHTDPLKTTRCEVASPQAKDSSGLQRPLIQYAIMIDAGSTGSRVHVYKFNYCGSSPELEDEYFEMLQGGLSKYAGDSAGAANSLRPLLESAKKRIPPSLHGCTPVSVKATAGLRLLGPAQSDAILLAVRHMLETEWPFRIADGKDALGRPAGRGVEVMQGRDEGVFAWITVNYLLNRIGSSDSATTGNTKYKTQTVAVMDLGGASTQIVFEPLFKSSEQGMREGEHVYKLSNFGSHSYTLYQNSYLGYGLMQARQAVNALTAFAYSYAHGSSVRGGHAGAGALLSGLYPDGIEIPSPCFAEGTSKVVVIPQPGERTSSVNVTMKGTRGGFEACKRFVEIMMDKNAVCASPPCSFGGVYQPSLMTTFAQSPIVALSYFYDRLEPLGLRSTFTIQQLSSLARDVCDATTSAETAQRFPPDRFPEAQKELQDRPETCLDLVFMHGLLSLGYELDASRHITVAKKLAGFELGWCLGAQLAVLEEEGVACRAR